MHSEHRDCLFIEYLVQTWNTEVMYTANTEVIHILRARRLLVGGSMKRLSEKEKKKGADERVEAAFHDESGGG